MFLIIVVMCNFLFYSGLKVIIHCKIKAYMLISTRASRKIVYGAYPKHEKYIFIFRSMKSRGSFILLIYLISLDTLRAEALNSLRYMYWTIKITNFTRLFKRPFNSTFIIYKKLFS